MKKLNFFIKLGLCALSATLCASAFAFTACDNDKSGDNEQKQEQTDGKQDEQEQTSFAVTETEWDAAMALDFNYSFAENVTFAAGTTMTINQAVCGNVAKQSTDSYELYLEKVGENYYRYEKQNDKWTKSNIAKENYASVVSEGLSGYTGNFDKFTFDGTDTYSCESMKVFVSSGMQRTEILMKNIKIKFNADKKVEKVDCVMYSGDKETDNSSVISMTFDYSEKTITLPQIAE